MSDKQGATGGSQDGDDRRGQRCGGNTGTGREQHHSFPKASGLHAAPDSVGKVFGPASSSPTIKLDHCQVAAFL